ncbi:MAG: YggT family protein [Actinomycetales bacterium]
MAVIASVLYFALFIYSLLVVARIVLEMIQSFAPQWRPSGAMLFVAEAIYTPTDPPLKALRRVLPSVPLGGVRLDLSPLVLLLGIGVLMRLVLFLGAG